MGILATSNRLIILAACFVGMLCSHNAYAAALRTLDDGSFQSYCKQYDFINTTVGNTGQNCTVTPDAAAGSAPDSATYITQTADATLSAEQAMGALGTGISINTTTTGVQSIYAGTSCTNQFPRSLDASGAATCATVVDADVDDGITVTNYLLLSGGTLTGELTADEVGIEYQETDALTDCSTFAATGGGMFYDDSEGIFKKCQDNVLTDLDTSGAEVNNLETITTGIATTEIAIGTAANTVVYAPISGDASMTNAGVMTVSNSSTADALTGNDLSLEQ